MGNSLQDQLLKANLANKKQAHKAKKQKHQARRKGGGNSGGAESVQNSLEQSQNEKIARDRELNRQRQLEAEQKAVMAQIRQLIQENRVEQEGEEPYRFVDDAVVRTIYVSKPVHGQISSGQLMIVKNNKQYALVPSAIAEKIADRDPSVVIHPSEPDFSVEEQYAGYEVPDDLMW